jgi:hypothetical protein
MIIDTIRFLLPNAQFVAVGDVTTETDYNTNITWHDDRPQPSWSDIQNAEADAIVAKANAEAQRSRRVAYASESDPLFFQWQRGEGTEQEWLDKVTEIRDRYPYVEP